MFEYICTTPLYLDDDDVTRIAYFYHLISNGWAYRTQNISSYIRKNIVYNLGWFILIDFRISRGDLFEASVYHLLNWSVLSMQ